MQETERSMRISYIQKKIEQAAIFKRSNLSSGKVKKESPTLQVARMSK